MIQNREKYTIDRNQFIVKLFMKKSYFVETEIIHNPALIFYHFSWTMGKSDGDWKTEEIFGLHRRTEKLRNMKVTVVPIAVGALGTGSSDPIKTFGELEN